MQFGICLARNGGSFSVGNIDQSIHKSQDKPIIVNLKKQNSGLISSLIKSSAPKFYSIDAQQLFIGTRSLQLRSSNFDGQGMFVDSGATYTYLPDRQYNIFMEETDEVCKQFECKIAKGQSSRCYHFTNQMVSLESQAERFPNLTISLKNSKDLLHWSPLHYFMIRNTKAREVCIGVERLGRMILGANWMTDRDIYFDLSDSRLLVYSSPNCGQNNTNTAIRAMYQSEKSALAETPFDNKIVQSQWLIVLFSTLTGIIIIALLLVLIIRCCQKKQQRTVMKEAVEEEDDITEETQEEITSPQGEVATS